MTRRLLEDFIKRPAPVLPYLCKKLQRHPSPTNMELTEKQKAARRLVSEYLDFLDDQEALVNRIFDRKWKQVMPLLEQMMDRKIEEHLSSTGS